MAPDGSSRQTKILSSAALRGRILERLGADRFRIAEDWRALPRTIEGLRFRLLDGSAETATVHEYRTADASLTLDRKIGPGAIGGSAFQLESDEEAPLLAARVMTGTGSGEPLPPCELRLATTLGTNALLERTGALVALFVTAGFGDLSRIGTQQRPDLFALDIERPDPLHDAVVEVDERLDATGAVLRPIDLDAACAAAAELPARGIRSAAIAFLHAYRNPQHERLLAERLLLAGFDRIACSSELAPQIKLLPRLQTAVIDAYLGPRIHAYLRRVREPAGSAMQLQVMTSAGGLIDADGYHAKDSLLSGPAGGVVGAVDAARRHGLEKLIGFDMGGTSTDVARFHDDYEYVYEHGVGEHRLAAPALAIESVAAGGGSICRLEGERLCVGPRSAGADPGPACYGAGGPLCVTDLNLLLGRLDPTRFGIPVETGPAARRLDELCAELQAGTGERADRLAVAEGLLAIADETMADAIRRISVRRGYDPAEHTLISFGGAGGQHAAAVADCLGIARILVPRDAALLSAVGLQAASIERFAEEQLLLPLAQAEEELGERFSRLEQAARAEVEAAGVEACSIVIRRRILHLRWVGQEATLAIDWQPKRSISAAFEARYAELFGHRPEARAIELESIRLIASSPSREIAQVAAAATLPAPQPNGRRETIFAGARYDTPVFERSALRPGVTLAGPALIVERHTTTVIPPHWSLNVTTSGLLLERHAEPHHELNVVRPEAARLELFTQRFAAIVHEMGERLERTSVSTNVKERLDFSCALLDPDGRLVVNAPHIPVHLGALGLCVRRLGETIRWQPGDVVVTNHPAYGGSHLPDVTVVTPVFAHGDGGELLGFVASRAHHAEIGGTRPGSMPPHATRLVEEGVLLPPSHVIRRGKTRWAELRAVLSGGRYPSRAVEDNLADLKAAVAANHAGAEALRALSTTHGAGRLHEYMKKLTQLSRELLRDAFRAIPDGEYEATEKLDDGTPIAVRIRIDGADASIDFTGSGAVHAGNLNATPAIVQSAVIYLLRLLIDRPLPLNEGLLDAVELRIPHGILDPGFDGDPEDCPAVVGGNVETSQRIVDTLIRALGLAACSQGTMNNLIFGTEHYGYYETIGGGAGATRNAAGASGVHTHMTNTRITDPELLEARYPVRVERFALRHGSGGAGRHAGGDGLVRELTFLAATSLSLLAQHRRERPFGLDGGLPGACGLQRIVRADGRTERLEGIDAAELTAGDRLIIETPGGGGCGRP